MRHSGGGRPHGSDKKKILVSRKGKKKATGEKLEFRSNFGGTRGHTSNLEAQQVFWVRYKEKKTTQMEVGGPYWRS